MLHQQGALLSITRHIFHPKDPAPLIFVKHMIKTSGVLKVSLSGRVQRKIIYFVVEFIAFCAAISLRSFRRISINFLFLMRALPDF